MDNNNNNKDNVSSRNRPGEGRKPPTIIQNGNVSGRKIISYGNDQDNAIWTRKQPKSRPLQIPDIGEEDADEQMEDNELVPAEEASPFSGSQLKQGLPISLKHHTLEDIFFAAGKLARSRADGIHPNDLQVVAMDGSETKAVSFVEWAREIEDKSACSIKHMVVIEASHYEDVISAYEAQIARLEDENRRLRRRN